MTHLAQSQLVSAPLCDFIHVRCDEKGISLRLSLVVIHLTDLFISIDPEERRIITVLLVLVQCLLYFRHVRFTPERTN